MLRGVHYAPEYASIVGVGQHRRGGAATGRAAIPVPKRGPDFSDSYPGVDLWPEREHVFNKACNHKSAIPRVPQVDTSTGTNTNSEMRSRGKEPSRPEKASG